MNMAARARSAAISAPSRLAARVSHLIGGQPRTRVVGSLAAVLALSAADTATVGAAGPQLQQALRIGKPEIGMLLAVTSFVGAVATVPAGMLVDRIHRVRLLTYAVVLWGVASAASGAATSFLFLLLTRVALGVVVAVAAPAVASLLGDYFPERERSRIYGYILAGELVGTGFGFIVAGDLAAVSWHAAFFALIPPAAALAWVLTRLPEPRRGGADRLRRGACDFTDTDDPYAAGQNDDDGRRPQESSPFRAIEARRDNVLRSDPRTMSLFEALRYVLRVPSNVVLIVSSALGYFFLAGVRGFGVEFVRHHYGLSQPAATSLVPLIGVGMLVGVLLAGRLADRQLGRGHRTARVTVAAVAVLAAVAVFVPALLTSSIVIAIPLLMLCGVGMGGTNPPLDAARLDVMPPGLWGRAEAVRTVLQGGAQAAAPVIFGFLASDVFSGADALRDSFLVCLVPLGASGLLLLGLGRRTYPVDAATAVRSATNPYPAQPVTAAHAEVST